MALTLGIDIGKRSIRGAVIRTSLRAQNVERYLEVPVSSIGEGDASQDVVFAAARELVAQLPSPPDSIVACIDGARGSLRVVEIPALAKKRAHEVLPFELDPLLPFAVDEAVVDYQEVAHRGSQLALMAAAVPESVVAEVIEAMAQVGLVPRELALGAAALDGLSVFFAPPPGDAWMLVHIDDVHTEIAVLRDGSCELARTLDEGSETLKSEAQAWKTALHQTLMKYRSDGGPLPTKLVVMGQGADDPGLVDWIGQSLGLEAESAKLPASQDASVPASAVFGKALALAARVLRRGKRIDLRRGKYALPRGMSQLREYALLAVLCSTALVFSYVFSVWAEYRVLAEERDALAEKLGEVTEQRLGEKTNSVKRARELLEGGGTRKDPLPRFDAFKALAAISAAVPAGVTHDTRELKIELDDTGQTGKVHLEGSLPDLSARDQVAEAIEAHECIDKLERGRTSTVPGKDRKNYTLDGAIACPGAAPKGKDARGGRR